jgi:hypothetical protein
MTRHRFEVADVIREHGDDFREQYGATITPEQRRVLTDLARCRTAALGGHVEACDRCGHRRIASNSCRNRHCPKCQAASAVAWLEARAAELLPVPDAHVVFTLPAALGPITLQNPRVVYDILCRASSETLLKIAADPKHLGARIGFLAVLHTWGQNLQFHPHVHCVVPAGGLSFAGDRWIACPENFFLPVRVLSRVFRGTFLALLRAAFDRGEWTLPRRDDSSTDTQQFHHRLATTTQIDWVVYAKPPFGGPEPVLKYLARYTHRVAISNQRLVEWKDGQVHFPWKDYAHGGQTKTMTLQATEFLRRFLLHVLPSGFVRIRHYGFLSNRHRQEQVAVCRKLLSPVQEAPEPTIRGRFELAAALSTTTPISLCPVCGAGPMIVIETVPGRREPPRREQRELDPGTASCPAFDSS